MFNLSVRKVVSKFVTPRIGVRNYTTPQLYEDYMKFKPIKIMTTRISILGSENKLREYLSKLNKGVEKLEGFESAETHWCPITSSSISAGYESRRIITSHTWKTRDDWNKWLNSEERKKIYEKYKSIVEKEDHADLLFIPEHPIFLL